MSGKSGTIVELNVIDALGWIELDEGGRVRFGGTALKGFGGVAGVGTRVEVRGTVPGFRGALKAVEVVPLVARETVGVRSPKRSEPSAAKPWATFVREHPRWSDVTDACVPCLRPAPRRVLVAHPLLAPWHDEIGATAPTSVSLLVPTYAQPDPLEPGPGDCFALGRIAYLEERRWPTCGVCARPLEMCLQLSPEVLADWIPGGRGLVALFCFHCGVKERRDPRVGHVHLVSPKSRVAGPSPWTSASSSALAETQRVTARSPVVSLPSSSWYRHRSRRTPETASSALFGFDDLAFTALPDGVDESSLDDLGAAYDDWLDEQPYEGGAWGGARLGGVAEWGNADETPACAHGEMLHLLDYNGGQFLDGALHVFACRRHECELAFVAEF